jgi:hypothetical protein
VLTFTDRLSNFLFVERVWRSYSDCGGAFLSIAGDHFEIAVTRHQGRTFMTLLRRAVATHVHISSPPLTHTSEVS